MYSTVYLAAEDEPGLAIGRILVNSAPPLSVYREENCHGFSGLRKKVGNFQQMGKHGLPVVMLTDLDHHVCPGLLIEDWLGGKPSEAFLFRVCVREIEAWILADRQAVANLLGLSLSKIPESPDSLPDPKKTLIELSQTSKIREIKKGFKPFGKATIGPDYNTILKKFIHESWDLVIASESSPSLARAQLRIRELALKFEL